MFVFLPDFFTLSTYLYNKVLLSVSLSPWFFPSQFFPLFLCVFSPFPFLSSLCRFPTLETLSKVLIIIFCVIPLLSLLSPLAPQSSFVSPLGRLPSRDYSLVYRPFKTRQTKKSPKNQNKTKACKQIARQITVTIFPALIAAKVPITRRVKCAAKGRLY